MNEVRKIKHDLDIQLIGSDISIRAVDTAANNMKFAELHRFESSFSCNSHNVISDPMIYSMHWPQSTQSTTASNEVIDFTETKRKTYLSLYHGDFNNIGLRLANLTNNFEDFTMIMNVPYGVQSQEK